MADNGRSRHSPIRANDLFASLANLVPMIWLNMPVLRSYFLGLVVAHLAWLLFFTTGQLLWKSRHDNSKPFGLDTLVITSVAGMALSGFGLLLLGFSHLLNPFGLVGLLIRQITSVKTIKESIRL